MEEVGVAESPGVEEVDKEVTELVSDSDAVAAASLAARA